ncbi:type IV secretion system protein VirB10 [Pandoraea cepalis]|uniref:Type IV secretion system protein VirB10 n=1 Tax=Pandoraea cepalis TaxID=2508294 RepID=A0AAW7MGD2_9BURK|nr:MULTISPECIES: type IV secretion system protein VirB10 [Burkholderiaceae]MDN4571824.1 type IV secretion system protein VirB10 [Pandoraea cepalis]MDN4576840.1 type IV secretion system protein VirB10 [Pandoraea cepalis]
MSDELNHPSGQASSVHDASQGAGSDANTVGADTQHSDLYDVPPTPQREMPGDVPIASRVDASSVVGSPDEEATGTRAEPAKPAHPDGFPDLNRHWPGAGGIAKRWLGILAFVAVTLIGAIWAVHRVVALHQADAKHARDVASDKPIGGRSFDTGAPSSAAHAASSASGTAPISVVAQSAASAAQAATSPNTHGGMSAPMNGPAASRPAANWYDADLIVGSGDAQAGLGLASTSGASSTSSTSGSNPVSVATGGSSNALAATLTSTQLRAAQASLIGNRDLRLSAGAKIPCAGDTAFDSTLAGISTCTVTANVYSDNGHVLLVERGSTVNTEFRSAPAQGQRRVFILSARIQTPNGVVVQIDSPAADALGRMGIDGAVDNHWGERLGAAFLLSLVQDSIGYLASRGNSSNGTVVFANTEQTGNDMASKVLNSTINIPPTVAKNQGADFLIVLARDIDFSNVYQLEAK